MASLQSVQLVYQSVVEDVINGVREAFLDEGMDEQVLQELKQLWDSKLMQSKAIDATPAATSQPAAQAASSSQQTFAPYHPGLRLPTHQQHVPVAHSNSVVQSMSENPPLAHQNSHIQTQPLNLQSGHPTSTISGMSHAAQTAMLSLHSQLASAQGRIGGSQVQLPNGQVFQFVNHPGQNLPAGSLILTSRAEPKTEPSQPGQARVIQLDGVGDSSSDEEDENDDNDDDDDDDVNEDNDDAAGEEEDPLNSGDDVSDADPTEVFDAENVVVCQFDKINRSKNRWKFHLKDGIMNLNGKDYVFQKAVGDAEW